MAGYAEDPTYPELLAYMYGVGCSIQKEAQLDGVGSYRSLFQFS